MPPPERAEPSPGVLAPQPVELAVILAAGEGSRLARHGKEQPKPGVPLLGLSLSERTVLACMDAGIRRFVVVLGHEKERVRSHFERIAAARDCEISFAEAPDWRLGSCRGLALPAGHGRSSGRSAADPRGTLGRCPAGRDRPWCRPRTRSAL
ncbi:MAG: NTP transferase domain-containing protein [Planctomycetota bacterium]